MHSFSLKIVKIVGVNALSNFTSGDETDMHDGYDAKMITESLYTIQT